MSINFSKLVVVALFAVLQCHLLSKFVEAFPNPLFKPILGIRKPYYGNNNNNNNYLGQDGRYGGGDVYNGIDDGGLGGGAMDEDDIDGMGTLGGGGGGGMDGVGVLAGLNGGGGYNGGGGGYNGGMAAYPRGPYGHRPYGHRHHRQHMGHQGDGLQSHYHRKRLHHFDEIQHSHNQNQFGSMSGASAAMLGFLPMGPGFGEMRRR